MGSENRLAHATVYDVAETAGVSVRTVGRFFKAPFKLAEATQERVREAISELDYRPNVYAHRMSSREQNVLAAMVFFANGHPLSDLHRLLLGFVSRKLCASGWDLLLIAVDWENEARVIKESVRQHKFDSLLLLSMVTGKMQAELAKSGMRVVTIDWMPDRTNASYTYVGIDYFQSSYDYTMALLAKGYRRIGYVAPDTFHARAAGAAQAVADFGSSAEYISIPVDGAVGLGEQGDLAVAALSGLNDAPDLLYCYSDMLALAVMASLQSAGRRVPEDVGVAGFDGNEMAAVSCPTLTTMVQPWEQMAAQAVDLLLASGETDTGAQQKIMLPTTIRWGESC